MGIYPTLHVCYRGTMNPEIPQPHSGFAFTEHERLYDRVSDARFMEIVRDEHTSVHEISTSTNSYGEFLFVTLSRPTASGPRDCITFYGLGYHDRRERWITDTWSWYDAHQSEERMEVRIDWAEVEILLQNRREEIAEDMRHFSSVQSQSALLFELLADLTDEDGAATELDDLTNTGFFDEE